MAKGYHVLAGLCRDLRNAEGDASEGSATAAELIDTFNELLDILDERSIDEDVGGEDHDDDGGGDDADIEDPPVPRETGGRVPGVGAGGRSPTQRSTRARAKLESRPGSRGRLKEYPVGVPRTVEAAVPTSTRARGKR